MGREVMTQTADIARINPSNRAMELLPLTKGMGTKAISSTDSTTSNMAPLVPLVRQALQAAQQKASAGLDPRLWVVQEVLL